MLAADDLGQSRAWRHRVAAWTATLLVFALLIASSVLSTLDGKPTEFIRFGEAAFLSLSLWLMLLAATRQIWIALVLAFPAIVLVPLEIWFRLQFDLPVSTQSVALALETTWSEIANFLTSYGARLARWWGAWLLLYAVALWLAWRTRIAWRHTSAIWCLLILPSVLTSMYFGFGAPPWLAQRHTNDPFDGQVAEGWSQQWSDVFPVNMLAAWQMFQLEEEKTRKTQVALQSQSLGGQMTEPINAPETVVLVIGESATAMRWSLLGYPRSTTPMLERREDIIPFSDTVGLSTATRTAIPGVLSRRPVLSPEGYVDIGAEPSLIKAFSEAGYQTHWYSNQSPFGKYDTSIAVYAREAQNVRFLNPSTFASRGNLDEVLLAPLQSALATPGRQLIVMHTLGSHFDYALRYPASFDRYQPSNTKTAAEEGPAEAQEERVGNSYDNSILYTDHFLSEVIHLVQQSGKSSVIAYFSDHGVDLPGGRCRTREAARVGESSFRVPVFFWASENFRESRSLQWQALHANKDQPYTTRAMFSTLLDLAGIGISGGLPADNFLATDLTPNRRRLVAVGDRLVDFDKAVSRNSCFISAAEKNSDTRP